MSIKTYTISNYRDAGTTMTGRNRNRMLQTPIAFGLTYEDAKEKTQDLNCHATLDDDYHLYYLDNNKMPTINIKTCDSCGNIKSDEDFATKESFEIYEEVLSFKNGGPTGEDITKLCFKCLNYRLLKKNNPHQCEGELSSFCAECMRNYS